MILFVKYLDGFFINIVTGKDPQMREIESKLLSNFLEHLLGLSSQMSKVARVESHTITVLPSLLSIVAIFMKNELYAKEVLDSRVEG